MGESDGTTTTSKPFTGPNGQTFESFDACVRTFEDEDGIDDPEAFCGWLQEEGKEALSDPNAEEVLTELTVEYVSAVDNPAQDSEWVIAKDAEGPDGKSHRWQSEVTLYVRKDSDDTDDREKQIAFAPVLIPKEADKQGDVVPAPAIEDAAHKYLSEYRKVDSDHDLRAGKGTPVESWTLKQDTTFELPDGSESRTYPEGTWVMGIKFDDETWERVKAGELDGLSIYGGARPIDVDALLQGAKGTDTGGQAATAKDADADDVPAWKQEDDPCWEGYVMVGTKVDENGNEVPRCVPEEDADEANLNGSATMNDGIHKSHDMVQDAIAEMVGDDTTEEDVEGRIAEASGRDITTVRSYLNGEFECPDFDLLEGAAEVVDLSVDTLVAEEPDSCEYDIEMSNEQDDPGDSGQEKGESVEKMLDEDGISDMLMGVRDADGIDGQSTIEDFVLHAIENGNVEESQITGMSVLLNGDSGGGEMSPEADGSDEDDMGMSGDDDDSIDLDVDEKSDEGDDAEKADDVEKSVDVDVDKSDDSVVADLAEAVETLSKKVETIEDKVDDRSRRSDKMNVDDLSDRIVKDVTGVDDADVARKAIREQVEKSDGDDLSVSYEGITDDEDAGPDANDSDGGSLHSSAANKRMVGGDN